MTREITGLAPAEPLAVEVSDLARHPVRMMLNRLNALPARAGYDEAAAGPSDRLAGRPPAPERATSPVQAWQGLVAETAQARHLLTRHAPLMGDPQRWDALADVAALAETLATTRSDLLAGVDVDSKTVRRERSHAAALAVEAREVARQAGTPTTPTGTAWAAPRPGTSVVFVARVGDLPAAAGNLGTPPRGWARVHHRPARRDRPARPDVPGDRGRPACRGPARPHPGPHAPAGGASCSRVTPTPSPGR